MTWRVIRLQAFLRRVAESISVGLCEYAFQIHGLSLHYVVVQKRLHGTFRKHFGREGLWKSIFEQNA